MLSVRLLAVLLGVACIPAHAGTWSSLASGGRPTSTRIYNGVPTADYPAVVAVVLLFDDGSAALCSGTLIAPDVVLTAAHCLVRRPIAAIASFFPDGRTQQDVDAVRFAINPDYAGTPAHDVGLLMLGAPAPGIEPMPIADRSPRPGRRGVIVGYGDDPTGQKAPRERGTVRLARCPHVFRPAGLAAGALDGSLCWRPKGRKQDTCHGDSGGPLVVAGVVAGVTSGGYPDCPGRLSWDTDVAVDRDWILSLL